MNGTYGFVYSGAIGLGIGVFAVTNGQLVGSDYTGGKYSGTVREDPASGEIEANFNLFLPGGIGLAQGTSPMELGSTRPVRVRLPPAFGDGEPVRLLIPPGQITVMVKRIPDDWAPYAASGFKLVAREPGE